MTIGKKATSVSAMRIPTLRTFDLEPAAWDRATCFEAGYLVGKNAGWRSVRPVIDEEACTGCLSCYMHCPDGTIRKSPDEVFGDAAVFVDLDFCKGCGICAQVCKFGAIAMVPESEVD